MRRSSVVVASLSIVTGAGAQAPAPDSGSALSADEFIAELTRGFDALDPKFRAALAPMMRAWIVDARDEAIADGAQAIPDAIRAAVAEHVPAPVLDLVRWRVNDNVFSIQQAIFGLGYAPAMTADHVLIFKDSDAAANPMLWAHELYHVMQFQDWGVDGFVDKYLTDYQAVETEATEFHWRWMKETGRVPELAD